MSPESLTEEGRSIFLSDVYVQYVNIYIYIRIKNLAPLKETTTTVVVSYSIVCTTYDTIYWSVFYSIYYSEKTRKSKIE